MPTAHRALALALLGSLGLLSTSGCDMLGAASGTVAGMACPELFGADALSAQFSADARANAKVRAFVQAAKDLAAVSMQAEGEVAEACGRMGADLGVPPAAMAPQAGQGGRASGACNAVAARIDGILRMGAAVQVSATPPMCQASADAGAVGQAGAHALACIGAAADATASASVRLDVSIRASASVSGRVGAGG
jgi:hypothetical protein